MQAQTVNMESSELQPEVNSLISELIAAKPTGDAPSAATEAKDQKIQERKRNLEKMRSESIHMLSLSVKKGGQKKILDIKALELELHEDLISAVLDQNCRIVIGDNRQVIEVPTFPELNAAGVELESMRTKIQRKMHYSEPYWFIFDHHLDECASGFEAMERIRDERIAAIIAPDFYNAALARYLEKLRVILVASKRLNKFQLRQTLERYRDLFPSPSQIEQSFCVSCQGPIRVPSLIEQATEEATLAEALAKQASADVLLAESAAKKKLNDSFVESIHAALFDNGALAAVTDTAYGLMAELLESLKKTDPNKANNRIQAKFKKKLEELKTLVDFNTDLDEVVNQLWQLSHVASSSVSYEHFQSRLADFSKDFLSDLEINPDDGDGHKALADYIML